MEGMNFSTVVILISVGLVVGLVILFALLLTRKK